MPGMTRIQTNDDNSPIPLQPQASPVQTYARPAQPVEIIGDSESQQLAKALSDIQPALTNFLVGQEGRNDQKAMEEARDMRAKTALNYKDAVKQGIIPLNENPFFVKAWREQDGSVAADRYNSDLTVALSIGDFAHSTDTGESEQMLQKFRQNWMQQNGVNQEDNNFLGSFARKADAYDTNAREHQAAMIGQRQVAQVMNNTYQEALGAFDDAQMRQLPATATAAALSHIADKLIAVGMNPKQVNGLLIDAATTKSLEQHNIAPLRVLESVPTGGGYLGRTLESTQRMDEIQRQITREQQEADDAAWRKEEHDRKTAIQNAESQAYDTMSAAWLRGDQINEQQMEPLFAQLGHLDPGEAESLRSALRRANTEKWTDDHETVNTLEVADLRKNLTTGMILNAIEAGKITPQTANKYNEMLRQQQREDDESYRSKIADKKAMNVRDDPTFRDLFTQIEKEFTVGLPMGFNLPEDKNRQLRQALTDAKFAAQQFRDQNPMSSIQDDQRVANGIFQAVTKGYLKDATGKPVDPNKTNPGQYLNGTGAQYDKLTAPTGNVGSVHVFASSPLEWNAMKDVYMAAVLHPEDSDVKPENTELGKILQQYNIGPEDLAGFLQAQDTMYSDGSPAFQNGPAAPAVHPQPVPGPTKKQRPQ